MRELMLLILLGLPAFSSAAEITCFENGKKIYHGFGHDIFLEKYFIMWTEDKSNTTYFFEDECVIRYKPVKK